MLCMIAFYATSFDSIALTFSESSMNNIQSVRIISAFPIGIIMILMIWSLVKDAKN